MQVNTSYGPGEIVATDRVAGCTQYRVAGVGFEVWVDAAKVHTAATPFPPDETVPKVDTDNSVRLPYDPSPQYPAEMFDHEQTIQPIHAIDPAKRTSPADSLTFRSTDHNPRVASSLGDYMLEPPDDEDIDDELIAEKERAWEDYQQSLEDRDKQEKGWGRWAKTSAIPGLRDMARNPGYREMADEYDDPYTLDGEALGIGPDDVGSGRPGRPQGLSAPGWTPYQNSPDVERHYHDDGPGLGADEAAERHLDRRLLVDDPDWAYFSEGTKTPDYDDYAAWLDRPEHRTGDNKYATWLLDAGTADHFNDPVQRFRDDPLREIQRQGHIHAASHDPETEQYGLLVEADKKLREAAWADVRAKAKRLRSEGHVQVIDASPARMYASVKGDHGVYDVLILRGPDYAGIGKGKFSSTFTCDCFLPDAPIMMADGTERKIAEVKPGDRVITHTGGVRRVVDVRPRQFNGEIAKVKAVGSYRELVATAEHRVLSGTRTDRGWHEIGSLRPGDYLSQSVLADEAPLMVSVPRRPGHKTINKYGARGVGRFAARHGEKGKYGGERWTFTHKDGGRTGRPHTSYFCTREEAVEASVRHHSERAFIDVKIDTDLAYWLGWYAAEGCLVKKSGGYQVAFTLSSDERWVAEQLDDITWRHFGVRGTIREPAGRNVIDYRISDHTLYRLAELLVGTGSHGKKLSEEMLRLPGAERRRFMDGWFYGDGVAHRSGQRWISTVSQSLAHQARELLAQDGYKVSIYRQATNDGGLLTTQGAGPIYQVRWQTTADSSRQFCADGSIWHRIESVSREPFSGEVWDIEVEDDHSFRAYGFNVHNCKWGKWAFKRKYTYVGRMCSHAYAALLEMQAQAMKGNPGSIRALQAAVDEKRRQVRDFENPLDGWPEDVLDSSPGKLTPDLIVPADDDFGHRHEFVDLGDDRKTTGPDQIMHFSNRRYADDDDRDLWGIPTDTTTDGGAGSTSSSPAPAAPSDPYKDMIGAGGTSATPTTSQGIDGGAGGMGAASTPAPKGSDGGAGAGLNPLTPGPRVGLPGAPGGGGTADTTTTTTSDTTTPGGATGAGAGGDTTTSGGAAGAGGGAGGGGWQPNGNTDPIGAGEYQIQSGDTLSDIAERAGLGADNYQQIADANDNITDPDMIYAGDTINIPGADDAAGGADAAADNVGVDDTLGPGNDNAAFETPQDAPGIDQGGIDIGGADTQDIANPALTGPDTALTGVGDALDTTDHTAALRAARRFLFSDTFDPDLATDSAEPGVAGNSDLSDASMTSNAEMMGGAAEPGAAGNGGTPDSMGGLGGGLGVGLGGVSQALNTVGDIVPGLSGLTNAVSSGLGLFGGRTAQTPAFSGSGPDPKHEWSTSQSWVDEHERPRFEDVTDGDGIVKYTNPDSDQHTASAASGDHSDVVKRFHASLRSGAGSALDDPVPTGDDIATRAAAMLRTAGRHFTLAEQRELEDETHPLGARNAPTAADLAGTHYVDGA